MSPGRVFFGHPRVIDRSSTGMVLSRSSALTLSIGPTAPGRPALLNMISSRPYSLTCEINQCLDIRLARYLGMLKHCPPASACNFSDHLFAALRIQVRSQHRGAFSRKAERSSTLDPTGRPRNRFHFSIKSAIALGYLATQKGYKTRFFSMNAVQ